MSKINMFEELKAVVVKIAKVAEGNAHITYTIVTVNDDNIFVCDIRQLADDRYHLVISIDSTGIKEIKCKIRLINETETELEDCVGDPETAKFRDTAVLYVSESCRNLWETVPRMVHPIPDYDTVVPKCFQPIEDKIVAGFERRVREINAIESMFR